METAEKPSLEVHLKGKSFKVLAVTGAEGMDMPEHYCTKEAVLIIQRGSAVLTMLGKTYALKQHDAMVIPQGEKHSLAITGDFQSHVVMELDAELKFA